MSFVQNFTLTKLINHLRRTARWGVLVKQHRIPAIRAVEDTNRNLLARLEGDEGPLLFWATAVLARSSGSDPKRTASTLEAGRPRLTVVARWRGKQFDFPIFERRIDHVRRVTVAADVLRSTILSVFCVRWFSVAGKFNDVRKDGVGLLHQAR